MFKCASNSAKNDAIFETSDLDDTQLHRKAKQSK